nr:hypothetical protein Iba_chr15aCG10350 [Ipomoea batatas]
MARARFSYSKAPVSKSCWEQFKLLTASPWNTHAFHVYYGLVVEVLAYSRTVDELIPVLAPAVICALFLWNIFHNPLSPRAGECSSCVSRDDVKPATDVVSVCVMFLGQSFLNLKARSVAIKKE